MTFSFVIFVFVFLFFLFLFLFFFSFLFKMCTVGLYVSLCLMIFLCPFLHCKALRTAMFKCYINSIIIIIIIIIKLPSERRSRKKSRPWRTTPTPIFEIPFENNLTAY